MNDSTEASPLGRLSSSEIARLRDELARLSAEQQECQARVAALDRLRRHEEGIASAIWDRDGRLHWALREAPFPLMIHAEDGEIVTLNAVWTELTGYRLEDIPTIDAWVAKAYGAGAATAAAAMMRRTFDLGEKLYEGETTFRTKDGQLLVWPVTSAPLGPNPMDGRRLVITMAIDVNGQREAHRTQQIKDFAMQYALSGIAIATLPGRLIYANEALLRMWGYQHPEQVLGKRVLSFWRDIEEAQDVGRALSERGHWIGELIAQRQDGSEFTAHLSASLVRGDDGEPLCIMASFVDITERKRAEAQLLQYAKDLEARTEELDAFTRTVAHDLTNPLARVIGYAEVLEQTHPEMAPGDLRKHLHTIAQAGRQASRIIEELLLLAHVGQRDDVDITTLEMGEIVNDVLERLDLLITEYQPNVVLPDSWPAALGYAPWIEQVWENYLSNAIKYGGRPPRLRLGGTVEEDGRVRYFVCDNGPGIPRDDWPDLFAPFSRLSQRPGTGHGLGLSIVKRIVEKLGGEVAVDSVEGQGSCFSFVLPAPPRRTRD